MPVCVMLSCLFLVVTYWERANLLAVMFVVFCRFPKCVLVHIRIKGEVGALETGLSPPIKYFTDSSKGVLLLWIVYVFFLPCICYAFVCVCLLCLVVGHLLEKG